MPNTENINAVIDAIRLEENFFNMIDYSVDEQAAKKMGIDYSGKCWTPACICGWANHLASGKASGKPFLNNIRVRYSDEWVAAKFLGIEDEEDEYYLLLCADANRKLFMPNPVVGNDSDRFRMNITREQAIRTLEILRDTGEIDWSHAGGR